MGPDESITDTFLRDEDGRIVPFSECPPEEQVRRRLLMYAILGSREMFLLSALGPEDH